ncbi:peptidylprolyl isomerase [Hyphococcus sp.]|uniref:peptidylprolyl isomerase n=1 Tax=Hyphococcus sp. TaxID=2038636 RepID=UPI0020822ED3|nr:MAG: peptidyl-prolyl cis-trans isomerase [Marinicaulis sp.]
MFRSLFILILLVAACTQQSPPPDQTSAEPGEAAAQPKRGPGAIIAASTPEDWRTLNPENILVFELEHGRVIVALAERLAQGHTAQIKKLVREGFYDGLSFYRVIDGFVAQGGDVFETREMKTAAKSIAAEFDQPLTDAMKFKPINVVDGYAARVGFINSAAVGVDEAGEHVWRLHCTGAMAMARNNEPDTGGTEFYIALQPQRYLDRNLTVFGQVVEGMDVIQTLRRVSPPESPEDDRGEMIKSTKVAADLPEGERPELEILRTDTPLFAEYVESRRNRPEEFFYFRPDHVDICALPIPVRPVSED